MDTPLTDADQPGSDEQQELQRQEPDKKPGFIVNDRRFWTLDEEELEEAEGQRPSQPTYIEQLERRLEEKDKQLREYIAAYKSEVVEGLERTKQRLERDAEAQRQQLRGQLAEPMIEVLEALERSLAAAESGADFASLLQGVKMVQLLMVQKLQTLGLERLTTVGQPFDPSLHEAVAVVPVTDPLQDNLVVNELKPGFKLGDRLVRAALVQVGKLQ